MDILREKLNKIDHYCIDNNLKFRDLRSLYEAVSPNFTPKDKMELKKVINATNDPGVIEATLQQLQNESLENSDLVESGSGSELSGKLNKFTGGIIDFKNTIKKNFAKKDDSEEARRKAAYDRWVAFQKSEQDSKKKNEAMTDDDVEWAILNDKPFELDAFKHFSQPSVNELKAYGAIQAKDIKVGDCFQTDFDQEEVDLGTLIRVDNIKESDAAWKPYCDTTFIVTDLDDGSKLELHYNDEDFIGFKVDPNNEDEMKYHAQSIDRIRNDSVYGRTANESLYEDYYDSFIDDVGKVDVKKSFTVSEFDEDDGWFDFEVFPGTYEYRVLDINGWKPRQLKIDDVWVDVNDNCKELEDLLGIEDTSLSEYFNVLDDVDASDSIGELKPGDQFKNRNDVIVTIIEPTKDGKVQFKIGNDVRIGTQKSIQHMLYDNNYMRIEESLSESKSKNLQKEIYKFLDGCGGYTDYNQKVEDVQEYFGLSADEAESIVSSWALGIH